MCVRSDGLMLRLRFHKGVLPVAVHCVKGNRDPSSALVLVETDSHYVS